MPKKMTKAFFRLPLTALIVALLALFLASTPLTAECHKARENAQVLGTAENRWLGSGGSSEWIEVTAKERGLLQLEIHSPAGVDPLLEFFGLECAKGAGIDDLADDIVWRTPEHITLMVEAGQSLFFQVELPATDGEFAARTSFLPLGPETKGGEDEEIIELDGLHAPPSELCDTRIAFTKGGEDEEIIELDGLRAPPSDEFSTRDDHGDSLACASFVGRSRKLAGRFEESGDVDTFRLNIGTTDVGAALWKLRPQAPESLHISLYDHSGLRLELDDSTAIDAGVYFLRVASLEDEPGDYVVALGLERW